MSTTTPSNMTTRFGEGFTAIPEICDIIICAWCKKTGAVGLVQLECFHLCCMQCIKQRLNDAEPGSKFNCLECHKQCMVPPQGMARLQEDLLQYKMEDISNIIGGNFPPCHPCEVTGEVNKSCCFCMTCRNYLCDKDGQRHRIHPDHRVVENGELKSGQYQFSELLESKFSICDLHSKNVNSHPMKCFCRKCKLSVCQECIVAGHKRHKISTVHEAGEDFRNLLKSKVMILDTTKQNCQANIENLEQTIRATEENCNKCMEELKRQGDDIKQIIDDLVSQHTRVLQGKTNTQKNVMKRAKERYHNKRKQVKTAEDYMAVFLGCGSDWDILQKHDIYTEYLTKCQERDMLFFYYETFDVCPIDFRKVEKILQKSFEVKFTKTSFRHSDSNQRLSEDPRNWFPII